MRRIDALSSIFSLLYVFLYRVKSQKKKEEKLPKKFTRVQITCYMSFIFCFFHFLLLLLFVCMWWWLLLKKQKKKRLITKSKYIIVVHSMILTLSIIYKQKKKKIWKIEMSDAYLMFV